VLVLVTLELAQQSELRSVFLLARDGSIFWVRVLFWASLTINGSLRRDRGLDLFFIKGRVRGDGDVGAHGGEARGSLLLFGSRLHDFSLIASPGLGNEVGLLVEIYG